MVTIVIIFQHLLILKSAKNRRKFSAKAKKQTALEVTTNIFFHVFMSGTLFHLLSTCSLFDSSLRAERL